MNTQGQSPEPCLRDKACVLRELAVELKGQIKKIEIALFGDLDGTVIDGNKCIPLMEVEGVEKEMNGTIATLKQIDLMVSRMANRIG